MDTLSLARELIRRPSVSPSDSGCQQLIAGLLERQTGGEVYINEMATSTLNDAERTRIRRTEIGFVRASGGRTV